MELTEVQATFVQWGAVVLWTWVALGGVLDAVALWLLNREACRVASARLVSAREMIGALGDLRRSRWFLFAFVLAVVAGIVNAAWRLLDPPPPDTSWRGAFFTYIIVAMLVCFRLAKRADMKMLKEQEAWLAKEPGEDRREGKGP